MAQREKQAACTQRHYEITREDLPLACPGKDMILWNAHPRVYLPVEKTGHVRCPYCEAHYTLIDFECDA